MNTEYVVKDGRRELGVLRDVEEQEAVAILLKEQHERGTTLTLVARPERNRA